MSWATGAPKVHAVGVGPGVQDAVGVLQQQQQQHQQQQLQQQQHLHGQYYDQRYAVGDQEHDETDEEDDDDDDEEEAADAARRQEEALERSFPTWLRYAKVLPRKHWKRAFLGGDEGIFNIVSFLRDVFYLNGTVLRRCFLPATVSALITGLWVSFLLLDSGRTALAPELFLPIFLVTLFVVGFRLFGAWHSYRKGHEMVLHIVHSAVDCLLTCTTSLHVRSSGLDIMEMTRRINILLAFIRQDLRESRHHKVDNMTYKAGAKKGRLAVEWFNAEPYKFIEDPYGSPPLKLLLKPGEENVYAGHSPQDRILICVISIRTYFAKHVNFGEQRMSTPDSKLFQHNVEAIVHSWGKCRELVRTPAPFVLHHLALLLIFVLTMGLAPVYFHTEAQSYPAFPVIASFLLTFALYGIEEAACEMEVPFGWRASDCNLTKMCRAFLKHSHTFCKICKVKSPLDEADAADAQ
ncbi:Hypothetical Protein FCC1311_011962 [Hondaea fermentalgiana]|uniref:Uncharacterized protein n=1 Tax=Hondaea fermentalgiana TaxID=2315210 RepID=A0A2R5G3S6_9STRA|nr:Hypothetical Protein FCC1311_011962 [Hondaea fermentalgiana]|eukprot:GBG24979.1 Hypothetical Protein FCC1311_011962 [Hondaea fermentalgiana]